MVHVVEEQTYTAQESGAIRRQLQMLLDDDAFKSSRRSVAFLRYIVEETLDGRAHELKERTIGVDVFGKALTYDTNLDHAVRTAATELRKRLAIYYGADGHRNEFRILLQPGSYVPQFKAPNERTEGVAEAGILVTTEPEVVLVADERVESPALWARIRLAGLILVGLVLVAGAARLLRPHPTPMQMFWGPLLTSQGQVLLAVGDVPGGPPDPAESAAEGLPPSPKPAKAGAPTVPFADSVAMVHVAGVFSSFGREVVIRRENSSSFADLRERPVVLIGAFNNEWSLRLTRELRFSLAMDPGRRLIYIRDREHPDSRAWQWSIDPHPTVKDKASSATLHDYALISRILDSETGNDIVELGGLYTYGTQAAGEFVSNPQLMSLTKDIPLDRSHRKLQIVLETDVTDGTPGPPRIVGFSLE
jgi:hypothetical protein